MKLLRFSNILMLLGFLVFSSSYGYAQSRDFYELKIYHIDSPEQEKRLDDYLAKAFIPALHRAGISKVGVFKPLLSDTKEAGTKVYVFVPYKSLEQFAQLPQQLEKDKEYLQSGKDYIDAAHNNAPYRRVETSLMRAFTGMPRFQESKLTSPKKDRVYELRSYESATEKLYVNKVKMFNEGEIEIFDRLGFNAIFYAEVIAGANMPNLMYLTTFENMDSEKAHWEAFRTDAQWEKMRVMEEYQNNVSRNDTRLLYPADYSDL
ncbi:MAG TPA: NIPSNAP family protein [Cyclobacteriaceae bacterium]|nr:NIPSNAP family protein [Cyclobacteriaceae bacterium]